MFSSFSSPQRPPLPTPQQQQQKLQIHHFPSTSSSPHTSKSSLQNQQNLQQQQQQQNLLNLSSAYTMLNGSGVGCVGGGAALNGSNTIANLGVQKFSPASSLAAAAVDVQTVHTMANIILSANQQQQQQTSQNPQLLHHHHIPLQINNNNNNKNNNNSPAANVVGACAGVFGGDASSTSNSMVANQRVSHWFQQNSNGPYSSPLSSNAPSMGDLSLSGVSMFTENGSSTTTLTHMSNTSKLIKTESNPVDTNKPENWIGFFNAELKALIEGTKFTEEMKIKTLKALKMFFDAVVQKKLLLEFDSRDFSELIRLLIVYLKQMVYQKQTEKQTQKQTEKQKIINSLLDNLASVSSSLYFQDVVRDQPMQTLRIFIGLLIQSADLMFPSNSSSSTSNTNTSKTKTTPNCVTSTTTTEGVGEGGEERKPSQQIQISNFNSNFNSSTQFFSSSTSPSSSSSSFSFSTSSVSITTLTHLLRIFYNTLADVPDKSEARVESVLLAMLKFMRLPSTSVRFFALCILRVLIHASDQLKKFVVDQRGLEIIIGLMNITSHPKFQRQALRTLNAIVDADQTTFAQEFVRLGGIDSVVSKAESSSEHTSEYLLQVLLTLKLVSDIPHLANMDLEKAMYLALRGTLPPALSPTKVSARDVDVYWQNTANALSFLRNACALNERGRNYLAMLDGGRPILHIAELATQSFDVLFSSSFSSSSSTSSSPSTTPSSSGEQLCCISSELMQKPRVDIGPKRRKTVSIILDNCLCILAAVNKECRVTGKVSREQKMVSKRLVEDERAMLLYQFVLLKLDRSEFHKTVLLSLKRLLAAGVGLPLESRGIRLGETLLRYAFCLRNSAELTKLAVEILVGLVCDPNRLHLTVISPLLNNNENYQPFKLLEAFPDYIDLQLPVLKLTKELCQRESNLKILWFHNDSNLNLLNLLQRTSNNREILHLCSKISDMLQVQIGENDSESSFYDIFTQTMGLEESGMS